MFRPTAEQDIHEGEIRHDMVYYTSTIFSSEEPLAESRSATHKKA